jgi:DHA1 family bicyclomycin/chloramphenicol resistance-like MFS transporter
MSKVSLRWSAWELRQLFLIVVVFVAACIETDIYLPAFPDMMVYFRVSEAEIQNILTWNFIGLCVSGPIYGPLSDAIGRKKPLMAALSLFLLGSVITVFSKSFNGLLFGRVLQGLGSGGCFSLGSAIHFDSFSPKKALKALNQLNTIIPVVMSIAPLAGGFLNQSFGFQSNFIAITAVVLLSWVICLFSFEESLVPSKRQPLNVRKLSSDFGRVLSSFPFWQLNLALCLLFAAYLAFLSISSVFFVMELGVPKASYPYFQGVILMGWLVASLSSSRIIQRWGAVRVKRIGIAILAMSTLGFLMASQVAPRNPYGLTLFMVTYAFGFNWLQTPYFGEVMHLMPEIKGILASVVTSFRLLITALVVAISSRFYDRSISSYASILLAIACVIAPMIWLRERNTGGNSEELGQEAGDAMTLAH